MDESPSAYDKIYYHFSTGEPIFINDINKKGNQLGEIQDLKDRPIIIFHYNPHKNSIFVTDPNFTISQIKVGDNEKFFKLTTKNEQGVDLTAYIFDYNFQPYVQPAIVVINRNYTINSVK